MVYRISPKMQIELIEDGFVVIQENDFVEKVVCRSYYHPEDDSRDGICTVHYYSKPTKELNIDCSVYNSQYGVPVSDDGTKLFVGSWYKREKGKAKGLMAYDIESGSLLWRLSEGKIRSIFVYPQYLVALQDCGAVFKVDIDNGEVLAQIKSTTIEQMFDLGYPYVLIDSVSGKPSVLDVERMTLLKKYSKQVANPSDCLSFNIRDAALEGDALVISGREEYPNKNINASGSKAFHRVIDNEFNIT